MRRRDLRSKTKIAMTRTATTPHTEPTMIGVSEDLDCVFATGVLVRITGAPVGAGPVAPVGAGPVAVP